MPVCLQYVWSAERRIACPSHHILRAPKENGNFRTRGVGFGIMAVASAPGSVRTRVPFCERVRDPGHACLFTKCLERRTRDRLPQPSPSALAQGERKS